MLPRPTPKELFVPLTERKFVLALLLALFLLGVAALVFNANESKGKNSIMRHSF